MISSEIKKKKLRKTISRKVIVRETRERKRGVDRHWRVADSGILNVAVEKKKTLQSQGGFIHPENNKGGTSH